MSICQGLSVKIGDLSQREEAQRKGTGGERGQTTDEGGAGEAGTSDKPTEKGGESNQPANALRNLLIYRRKWIPASAGMTQLGGGDFLPCDMFWPVENKMIKNYLYLIKIMYYYI